MLTSKFPTHSTMGEVRIKVLRVTEQYLIPPLHSAFGVDDLQNQPLADWYGIVMGTSHEEPMMRSIPNEWSLFGVGPWDYSTNMQNIYNFWVNGTERAKPYENLFTVGMRGLLLLLFPPHVEKILTIANR